MSNLEKVYDNIVLRVGKAVGRPTNDYNIAHNTADALFVTQSSELAQQGKEKEAVKHLETMFRKTLGVQCNDY